MNVYLKTPSRSSAQPIAASTPDIKIHEPNEDNMSNDRKGNSSVTFNPSEVISSHPTHTKTLRFIVNVRHRQTDR